jgi:FlaA1/EpsC-like NDP-sugar epimerase
LALNVAVHVLLFALALLLAYLVRFDSGIPAQGHGGGMWFTRSFLLWLPYFVALKVILFWWFGLLHGGWQYTGIRDITSILLASWAFVLITFVGVTVFHYVPEYFGYRVRYVGAYFRTYSKGVLVLDFLATVFLVSTARLAARIYREELRPVSSEGLRRVLVVGAGDAGEAIIREILRMRVERYRVVGLVDDDPAKRHMVCHGVSVLGTTEDIRRICEEEEVDEIIIAIPSATQKEKRRVIELCSGTKLQFKMLPGVGDLIDGRVTVSQIRPVDINDLLGREVVELDTEAIRRFLRGRTVLVTGAGGSIGAEMCRQIGKFGPGKLLLVEQAETALFEVNNELRETYPAIDLTAILCDIYDRRRVMHVWATHRPDVVIHAAAHKHVPMMERNPCEAIKNNVLGTRNVADASCRYDCAEFVTISTDKAVNPSSIMGVTKRVAELYTQSLNGHEDCPTQFKAVRFGNVLGSAGSVVPIFEKQIARGGPVTVTDPEMTRYFMTIPEAAQLVLQAAATGTGGQIYLLDMGEPVKIVDLARQMITLSGFRPGEDIDITFTGVRPGEKLFEELRATGENVEPTVHSKIVVWKSRPPAWDSVQASMAQLEALQNCGDRSPIVEALAKMVPEYCPSNGPQPPVAAPATGGPTPEAKGA